MIRNLGRVAGVAFARLVLVLAIVAAARPASAAVDDFLGRIVGAVHLTIEGRETSDSALSGVVRTQVGQPLTMAAVRETMADLFSFRRFEEVQVDATLDAGSGKVWLRYDLTPIHPVTKFQFNGANAPGIDQGELRRAILDRFGLSPQYGRAPEITEVVADALAKRGYLHATITPRIDIEHTPERATMTLAIEPGTRTTIGNVTLLGQPSVPPPQFLSQLGLTTGTPYERDVLDARIERYVAERRKRGYYEARVVPTVALADGDRVANLTVEVSPGPRVRVVFEGDSLPAERREDLVPVEREGSVDEDLLEDSTNRIEEYLRSEGYQNATAPHARQDKGDELVITFTIKRGQQARVSTLKITGNQAIPLSELPANNLKLRVSEPFSEARLDADIAAIQDVYRRRGYASARASGSSEVVTATPPPAQIPVAVSIVITEGVRTVVDEVRFSGNESVPDETLRGKIRLQAGAPFIPSQVAADLDAIRRLYEDRGYDTAAVEARPTFTESNTRASVTFAVREGPRVTVDHVLIVGNSRTSTETIVRELQVKSGDPFSRSAILEGQRRLTALGLFRRVLISEIPHGGETTRDVLVTVEEAPPTTIGYGGGLEGRVRVVAGDNGIATDRFEVAPRASFEIGRRNLFGKNRSVNLFTSVSLHPKDSPIFAGQNGQTESSNTNAVGFGLTEYRVVGTYREPRVFDTTADAFVNGTFEQQIRSSFNFARRSASAVVARRLTRTIAISGTYQIQKTHVFNENVDTSDQLLIDRTFTQFLLSSFSASLIRDTRDDKVDASAGEYLSANTQLAGQHIGSEVGFTSSRFAAQIFRVIPHTDRIVFAGQAQVGLAAGFTTVTVNGQTAQGQLPASERFFAGGDTTVRGFALDQLGVRHLPQQSSDTIDPNGFPLGGNGLVVFNAEMRAPLWRGLGAVGFVDSGNVFQRATDISLTELRSAVGAGLRYKSPVGPIRVDLGFKVNRQPGESLTAFFISFGQAF